MPSLSHDDQIRPFPFLPSPPQSLLQRRKIGEPSIQCPHLPLDRPRIKRPLLDRLVVLLVPLGSHPLGRLDGVERVDVESRVRVVRRGEEDSGKETSAGA